MAAGDIALTTPINAVVIPGFTLARFDIDLERAVMRILFKDAAGQYHVAELRDTDCIGFSISGSTVNDGVTVALSGEYTKILGIIFGAGASTPAQRRTAAVGALKTDGVINVVGTVG